MPKIPAPRKPSKAQSICPKSGCQRSPNHKGKCGEPTRAEKATLTPSATSATTTPQSPASGRPKKSAKPSAPSSVMIPARKKPIAEALKEVKKDPLTKEIAKAIPATQKKRCAGCGKNYTARPSGLLPPHKDGGEPCLMKAPPKPKRATAALKGKKFLCPVSEKDGCGRMIGVMPSGLLAKHIRKDGTPCPGQDLRPGSPLPPVKKPTPINKKGGPKSRPIHDREDRSDYHKLDGIKKSDAKALALMNIVEQYGWEFTPRYDNKTGTVELTMTRGPETIYIYWVNGVCAGEHITYTFEDYTTKLRNASAVKMRAAVPPKTTMTEVKKKMEHRAASARRMKALNEERELNKAAKKSPDMTLGQRLLKETDEKVAEMVLGKWVGWRNRLSGNEETAEVSRNPRNVLIRPSALGDDRTVSILDPAEGYRAFMLSQLLRIQSTPMRRRTNVHDDNDHPSVARKAKAKTKKVKVDA